MGPNIVIKKPEIWHTSVLLHLEVEFSSSLDIPRVHLVLVEKHLRVLVLISNNSTEAARLLRFSKSTKSDAFIKEWFRPRATLLSRLGKHLSVRWLAAAFCQTEAVVGAIPRESEYVSMKTARCST
ncbi:hypothetical protein V5799_013728 [Amblyomma americanum]|uniref:Uncharacterized protein n=1 Tax=Amblyomma americanum TaxID=6943 RepID=A0AAQ4E527_AMBAM